MMVQKYHRTVETYLTASRLLRLTLKSRGVIVQAFCLKERRLLKWLSESSGLGFRIRS